MIDRSKLTLYWLGKITKGNWDDMYDLVKTKTKFPTKEEENSLKELTELSKEGYEFFYITQSDYPECFKETGRPPIFYFEKGNHLLNPSKDGEKYTLSILGLGNYFREFKVIMKLSLPKKYKENEKPIVNLILNSDFSLATDILKEVFLYADVRLFTPFNLKRLSNEQKEVVDYVVNNNGLVISISPLIDDTTFCEDKLTYDIFSNSGKNRVFLNFCSK